MIRVTGRHFLVVALGLLAAAWLPAEDHQQPGAPIDPELRAAAPEELVAAYVVLAGTPLAEVEGRLRAAEPGARTRAVAARAAAIAAEQQQLSIGLTGADARVVASFRRLANAVQIIVPAGRLAEVARLPGVARLDRVGIYSPMTSTSVPGIGAPRAWQGGGRGQGVRIGVVDSGIDYLHADFGGPGTVEAYEGNDRAVVETGSFPTAKVVAGHDFAGDAYDALRAATPHPDPDPLDCAGHGTHVAGIIAGYGVLADGTTFRGPWLPSLEAGAFAIGPGVAPAAELVALKVFGCHGPTALVMSALEWAADPNGDGDGSDRLDVLNLSLGCDVSCNSPTERAMVERLAASGTFVAAAAGNAGNAFFVSSDPGVAPRALSVAATIDSSAARAARLLVSSEAAGTTEIAPAGWINEALLADSGERRGPLVAVDAAAACSPIEAAPGLAGAVAIIEGSTCPTGEMLHRLATAGALAAVLVAPAGGAAGSEREAPIPAALLESGDSASLRAAVDAASEVALVAASREARAAAGDALAAFSARGPAPSGLLKPDVAAPGETIESAAMGSGHRSSGFAGTSMATAHATGAAALLIEAHPAWSVEEVKAALVNTATPLSGPGARRLPESLAGAGAIQADAAMATALIAFGDGPAGAVSLSLGAVQALEPTTIEREITLVNRGASATQVAVVIEPTLAAEGVEITVPSPRLVVPSSGSAKARVRFAIDPRALRPAADPTAEAGATPRHRLPEVSGRVSFRPEGGAAAIVVPYHMAVSAAADLRAGAPVLCRPAGHGRQPLLLPLAGPSGHPHPLTSAFQLGARSDRLPELDSDRSVADLLAVGAASDLGAQTDASRARVYFGIATAAPWSTLREEVVRFEVWVDTNRDGEDDLVIATADLARLSTGRDGGPSRSDTFVTTVRPITSAKAVFDSYVNVQGDGALDLPPYNADVLVMPVTLAGLGRAEAGTAFDYHVRAWAGGELVDRTARATFDPTHPILDTAGAHGLPFFEEGAPISLSVETAAVPADAELLILHHTNTAGRRFEIVRVAAGAAARLGLGTPELPDRVVAGGPFTARVSVENRGDTAASAVVLTGSLPVGMAVLQASAGAGACTVTEGVLRCELGTLAPGAAIAVTVEGVAGAAGVASLTLIAGAAQCEAQPEDNAVTLEIPVSAAGEVRRRLRPQ